MKLRTITLSTLVLMISSGVLFASQAAATGMPMRTEIVHVKPFLPSGGLAPGYAVAMSAHGHCFSSSASTDRSDAFRCLVGNSLFDPCFRNPAGSHVACVTDSLSKLVLIHLTQKLPQASSGGKPSAWRLRIANGATCQFETGATFADQGKRANFDCSDKSWLFGHANSKHEPWQIRRGHGMGSMLKWVAVRSAWF